MKSRFEFLESAADRRRLALFRSSAAVGVVLSLVAISLLFAPSREADESIRRDLFAMEIGEPAVLPDRSDSDATPVSPRGPEMAGTVVAIDELAVPPDYIAELMGY